MEKKGYRIVAQEVLLRCYWKLTIFNIFIPATKVRHNFATNLSSLSYPRGFLVCVWSHWSVLWKANLCLPRAVCLQGKRVDIPYLEKYRHAKAVPPPLHKCSAYSRLQCCEQCQRWVFQMPRTIPEFLWHHSSANPIKNFTDSNEVHSYMYKNMIFMSDALLNHSMKRKGFQGWS